MAVLPDYTSGTITLANGSTAVTGTGTMFQTAAFRAGDTLQIQNLTAVIASVDSNTKLTLTVPWTGTSLTNAPYRARYLPDGARVTAETTTLIELLGNGNLEALAALTLAEGSYLRATGPGAMEAVDGKNLDALRSLSLVADKLPYASAQDTLDLTDFTASARALINLSGTAANGTIPVITGTGASAVRPIVGTVSQVGGIPTGALFEVGSNANGSYLRLPGGWQVCLYTITMPAQAINTSVAVPWTYPAAFVVKPYLKYSVNYPAAVASDVGTQADNGVYWEAPPDTGAAYAALTSFSYRSAVIGPVVYTVTAEGRWY
ncbi:hypothetical protein GCM10011491_31220 [Brucella endophytica]|uniref:Tail fiber protein n=1 Tax=Brucella endophytica TaxID=1963359 RepID=A0A916SKG0_9HYPH|nr:hypothetical protein [Brucella endophytica]GGB00785.1 hypothetical protein GCM10011491_31220 [Brucella endophytica]